MSLDGCFQNIIVDFLKDLPRGVSFKPGHLFMIEFISKYVSDFESEKLYSITIKLMNEFELYSVIKSFLENPDLIPTEIKDEWLKILEHEEIKKICPLVFTNDIKTITNTVLSEMRKNEDIKSEIIKHFQCAFKVLLASNQVKTK